MRPLSTALLIAAMAAVLAPAVPAAAAEPAAGYIVTLRDQGTDPGALGSGYARQYGGQVGHVYRHAVRGFAGQFTQAGAAAIGRDPRVLAVEPDVLVHTTAQATPTGIARSGAAGNANLKINGTDDYSVDADIAVIDTGVDAGHPDLNVVARTSCLNTTTCTDNSGTDDHGHGSHVAGTIAARDNGIGVVGVAPGARIWSVKVLDSSGSGQLSGVVAGIDWVAAHSDEIEVANMSLGCNNCENASMNTAITNAVGRGVVFAVAAGNNHADARTFSPANHPDVITVSALADFNGVPGGGAASTCRSDQDDTLADFSNFGSVVEITAPGTCIYSTSKDGGYATLSGTSMAAPHVAGAAALLTANGNRATGRDGVAAVRQRLLDTANTNWTDDSGDGVREPLLDVSSTADYPAGTPDPGRPVAAFTAACSAEHLTCSVDASASRDPDGTLTGYTWEFGDGATGSGKTASHTYPRAAYYSVKLTVTDNAGKTNVARRLVKAGDLPPTAAYLGRCSRAVCSFDASSSADAEGPVSGYTWSFGDGTSGTGRTVSHTYPAETRTYTVSLTVSDSRGQTSAVTRQVRCTKVVTSAICFAS
ncbi:S8 family serine peptidase [Longispora albida]|uniref:S8 family serine peptidase n=1 Tax=Longispora albida TaxID=203523 RepID=UPI0003A83D56|nr:S8 family serine peptidase [Longispora albida]